MKKSLPPHLPEPFMDRKSFDQIYRNNFGLDSLDHSSGDWMEIRLPPNLSAVEVYQRLPTAEKFEYGGYLTKTRIRYVRCQETSATTISSKHCTFHSHPTNLPGTEPDLPSAKDIYSFLKWKQLRAITVGKELLWVFDKTPETIPVIKKLVDWEAKNMVAVMRELKPTKARDLPSLYSHRVLKELGLDWPMRSRDVDEAFHSQWPALLVKIPKIDVSLYDRVWSESQHRLRLFLDRRFFLPSGES